MCVPGGRSSVAKPMIWLYLRSGSPFFTARVRILWPGGTRVNAATSPSTVVLGRMSMRATTTLSLGCRRMVSGAGIVWFPSLAGGNLADFRATPAGRDGLRLAAEPALAALGIDHGSGVVPAARRMIDALALAVDVSFDQAAVRLLRLCRKPGEDQREAIALCSLLGTAAKIEKRKRGAPGAPLPYSCAIAGL